MGFCSSQIPASSESGVCAKDWWDQSSKHGFLSTETIRLGCSVAEASLSVAITC